MITRLLLILLGLVALGTIGAFLFYVSVLSLLATSAVVMGLIATLVLGYWAGSVSPSEPTLRARRPPEP
jgi:hypothetical protein